MGFSCGRSPAQTGYQLMNEDKDQEKTGFEEYTPSVTMSPPKLVEQPWYGQLHYLLEHILHLTG